MNDDEKELLKAGTEAAMRPFADLITKLFGGPVEQVGGMWTDDLVVRRKIRQIKLMRKLQRAIADGGFEPNAIPDKIWIPALQEALLEDDEHLQETWANLMANAADPRRIGPILPSFAVILKELTSVDVKFLDALVRDAEELSRHASPCPPLTSFEFDDTKLRIAFECTVLGRRPEDLRPDNSAYIEWRDDETLTFKVAADTLTRNGLIAPNYVSVSVSKPFGIIRTNSISLTDLAVRFVMACRTPSRV
ncbi:MAG TPA: Abi-alpha family protein [Bryobacteraceae bacterium]|nr:Abi-alpha family protein [Bryobacteraceae bacterium]